MSGRACVIWLTGLSGAGKTTIARAVVELLQAQQRPVELLDGDMLRDIMPTGFSREEREAHVRRVGFFASRLEHHGVTSVASLISPYRASREHVRRGCRRFVEVYVSTPLSVCEERDVKGLYARARAGQLSGFTGIDDPYEAPLEPELTIDSSRVSLADAARSVVELAFGSGDYVDSRARS
jgi:adenylylsulfate kinase